MDFKVLWLKLAYRAKIKDIRNEYEEFVIKTKEKGITICNAKQMAGFFAKKKIPSRCVGLIHDVDYESGKNNIHKVLNIERKHKVVSTFFVRPYKYSLESLKNLPRQWEIGLHGEFKGVSRVEKAIEQKKALEKLIGRKVVGVSMHKGHWEGNETIDAAGKAGFFYIISYFKRKGKIITLPYEASDISPIKNLKYLNDLMTKKLPKKFILVVNTHADYF